MHKVSRSSQGQMEGKDQQCLGAGKVLAEAKFHSQHQSSRLRPNLKLITVKVSTTISLNILPHFKEMEAIITNL